jgi:hypothetical protein
MKIYTLLLSVSVLNAIELPPITVESSKLDDTVLESSSSVDILDANKLLHVSSIEELSVLVSNTNISGISNRVDKTVTMRGIS